MQSLSLVMSECFLSGRGQGYVSNFYIVDLENFVTASRRYAKLTCWLIFACSELCHRYTGDIHKSSVVGLFMTLLRQ